MHQVLPSPAAMNTALKAIFFVHLVFITWALQSTWAPTSYFFYNLIFIVTLIWGLHQHHSEEAIRMALFLNIICVFLDVVNIGVFYPHHTGSMSKRFSAGMAILNLLLRPISSYFLYQMIGERQAVYGCMTFEERCHGGIIGSKGSRRGPYEDIDAAATASTLPVVFSEGLSAKD